MFLNRTFFGKTCGVFFLPQVKNNNKMIIICPGLPSQPENWDLMMKFAKSGCNCLSLKYQGTWESEGEFLDHSPADDVVDVIRHLSENRSMVNLYDNSVVKLDFNEIILVGSSFGGSIALVAGAKSKNITKIIANAPVIDFSTHASDKTLEQDLKFTGKFLNRAYGRAYSFKMKDWQKLIEGKLDTNPISYTSELSKKKVLLIHGENDKTILPSKSVGFFDKLESKDKELLMIPEIGHISLPDAPENIWNKINTWILH